MIIINHLLREVPCWLIAAGAALTALTSGMVILRRRRARTLRRYKTMARLMLMEVRRTCVLAKSSLPLDQVPGTIRRIRKLAESAHFQLGDIGASEKQLEKFLMIAKDGKVPDRTRRPMLMLGAEGWLVRRPAHASAKPSAIELPPAKGGDMAVTTVGEPLTEDPPPALRNDRRVDFNPGQPGLGDEINIQDGKPQRGHGDPDVDLPELGDEIIIEIDESQQGSLGQGVIAGGEPSDIHWFSSQDLGGDEGPDIDLMFDRITMTDEQARATPSQAIMIRVNGKKHGFMDEALTAAEAAAKEDQEIDQRLDDLMLAELVLDDILLKDEDAAEPDVERMFDRLTRSDEEAPAGPAEAITVRVNGKKLGQ